MENEQEVYIINAELRDEFDNIPILDLHGLTAQDAIREINDFISHQRFTGESSCRIVHGKGRGILEGVTKKEVEKLMREKIVTSSFPSRHYPGAAITVVFT